MLICYGHSESKPILTPMQIWVQPVLTQLDPTTKHYRTKREKICYLMDVHRYYRNMLVDVDMINPILCEMWT